MINLKEINQELRDKAEQLKKDGVQLYSISRINTFDDCAYSYWNNYINNNRGIGNIYSFLGSEIHNILEEIYNHKADKDDLVNKLYDSILTAELSGIKFPSETIGQSWTNDMTHFVKNFEKHDSKCETELYFLFELLPNIWLNGFIDIIKYNEDGSIDIVDYKTSSKFKKQDIEGYGYQLIIYALAMQHFGYKVNKVYWNMLKYQKATITYKGKTTESIVQRGKWVKELQAKLSKMLFDLDFDAFDINILIEKAIELNNIDDFPESIKECFKFEEHMLEHEVTLERIENCKNYIKNSVTKIENMPKMEEFWHAVEINKSSEFFCNILCNHRKTCKHLTKYLESKDIATEVKPKSEFEKLFE